ncbi:hypothetical protein ACFC8N_23310 [Streptomyces sp. NPDC055966]|uniref:hypothetical protein n=1 Tax=Streptomyces sp. NPDC055966 TaxID=3345669 RepID=UPI0035E07D17
MPETWDYTLYIPNDPRAVTVCRRTPEGVVWIGAWDTDPAPPDPPLALEEVGESEGGRGLGEVRVVRTSRGVAR